MKTYGQYCPIARASEILAERWTPIIVRNMLSGATSYTEIASGAPGIPRSLLATRLRELERCGIVEAERNSTGRSSSYRLSQAGRELEPVIAAIGAWGHRWMELGPRHLDPGMVLHSWVTWYLVVAKLPADRVVARFDFTPDGGRALPSIWVVFDADDSEVCRADPGFGEDLIVQAHPRALAEWHLGEIEWHQALRAGTIHVSGPSHLSKALPTWNARSPHARSGPRAYRRERAGRAVES